jgi:exopolyphosphatase / guanosine-5'-triphosphate,3'-diphosphate pyrophosphatase
MPNKSKFAAIDIGSNAIRMVIAENNGNSWEFVQKFRLPIRLGEDVFDKGQISHKNLKLSARTFEKFAKLCLKNEVSSIRAVATSALRESKNRQAFVELVHRKSLIRVDIIGGQQEALLIFEAVKRKVNLTDRKALLIDVGGGSVELTAAQNQSIGPSESFPFGTVRTLSLMKQKKIGEEQIHVIIDDYMKSLSPFLQKLPKLDVAIGTGGNLETVARLRAHFLKREMQSEISENELGFLIDETRKHSVKERVEILGLKPDRADVILPAMLVVHGILRRAGLQRLLIPRVGLKEGILWSMLASAK